MTEPEGPTLRTEPTDTELSEWAGGLLAEIDEVLSSDAWAILDLPTDRRLHLMYDAAALRHCAALLTEIEAAAHMGQELSVRILARTHIEAFLYALFIHFGGYEALMRVAQDTLDALESTQNDFVAFDEWLIREKKQLTKLGDKIRRNNAANSKWNTEHPDQMPRLIMEEPYVPQLSTTSVDLRGAIAEFGDVQARSLSVRELVDALTKWAPDKGFGRESFAPIYHIYRVISGGALHPTLNVFDAYFRPGGFVRTVAAPSGPSMISSTRVTTLYGTAFLAGWILGDAGSPTPMAKFLRSRLEPDPSGGRGWAPGV